MRVECCFGVVLFAVCCLLCFGVDACVLFIAVKCLLIMGYCLLSVVNRLLCVGLCLLLVRCCLLFTVSCLLFAICFVDCVLFAELLFGMCYSLIVAC